MAIAPVRLKINTPSEIEREPQGERVMEEGESDKARESDIKRVSKERCQEREVQDQLGPVVQILFISVCYGSGVLDKQVLSHRLSLSHRAVPDPSIYPSHHIGLHRLRASLYSCSLN